MHGCARSHVTAGDWASAASPSLTSPSLGVSFRDIQPCLSRRAIHGRSLASNLRLALCSALLQFAKPGSEEASQGLDMAIGMLLLLHERVSWVAGTW